MAEPIRVAQMMTDMNYGGVEMVVMNYYRHIDRTKVQFDFLALEGSAVPQREEIEQLGGRVYIYGCLIKNQRHFRMGFGKAAIMYVRHRRSVACSVYVDIKAFA